jgi:hypothetical protein
MRRFIGCNDERRTAWRQEKLHWRTENLAGNETETAGQLCPIFLGNPEALSENLEPCGVELSGIS